MQRKAWGIYRRARLYVETPDRVTVVHGVKSCHFIDTHGRHLQKLRDLIHHTYTGKTVLALAKIEQGHHSCFFVLGRVSFEDLGDELLIDGVEFKRN